MTFFVVYLILAAMARRTKARFPQGERLLEEERRAAARRASGGERPPERSGRRPGRPRRSSGVPARAPIHRLNPLTKATLATVTAVAAVVLGGLVGPVAAGRGAP